MNTKRIAATFSLFILTAAAAAEDLHITVANERGEPLAGAQVELHGPDDEWLARERADGTGRVVFRGLDPGSYELELRAAGFEPATLAADLDGDVTEVGARLEPVAMEAEITVTSALPDFVSGLELRRREIEERGKNDLVEALRYQSGISAVRRGAINLDPTVRGLQENQVGMFVDGTRTFAAGPGRMDSDLSHLSQHAVRGVQVVKGPYALTWGSGTMSAIQLETFKPPFSGAGSQFGGRLFGAYSDNSQAEDLFAHLWLAKERYRVYLSQNERAGKDYEAGSGQIVPADFESSDTRWGFDAQLSDSSLIEYSGGYQGQDDIDYPGRLLDATYFRTRSHNLEYQWSGGSGFLSTIHAQLYSNRKDHLMNNDQKPTAMDMPGRMPPFGIRVDLPTESNTTGARFDAGLGHGAWQSKAGIDLYRSEQSASRTISRRSDGFVLFEDIVWPNARTDDVGLFWQSVRRGHHVEVGGTVRLDLVDASPGEVSDFFLDNTTGDLAQSEENVSAAFSAAVHLSEGWQLDVGIGRAVRSPITLERYSDRFPSTKFQIAAEFMGQPDIRPEKSLELNLGSRYQTGRGLSFFVDLFYREIDDYITVSPDPDLPTRLPLSPPVVYRYVNGPGGTFWGGELRLEHRASDWISWRAGVDYVRGEDDLFDEPALGMPPLETVLGLRLHHPGHRYWVDLQLLLADDQDRVAAARFEQPTTGYELFDLRGGVSLLEDLEITIGVENLTDEEYSHHLNSPNPFLRQRVPEIGRNVQLAVAYRF